MLIEAILILENSSQINSKVLASNLNDKYKVIQPITEIDLLYSISRYNVSIVIIDSKHESLRMLNDYFKRYHPQIPLLYVKSSGESSNHFFKNPTKEDDPVVSINLDELLPQINKLLKKEGNYLAEEWKDSTPLTFQEERILRLLEKGLSNKEIADLLRLKETTVKTYNYVLFQKLAVKNRTQAVIAAKETGII